MPYYRIFFLNHGEHVVRAEVVASRGDAEVIEVVRKLLAARPSVECSALDIWQADRHLGRLSVAELRAPPSAAREVVSAAR